VETGTITVRTRSGEDLGNMSVEAYAQLLNDAVLEKGRFQG
jgi:threonyl-tRNA synthetase